MSKVVAIIPARGGSKGIPGKNILPIAGKPLIAWTIHAAQRAQSIDRIIVSTDDEEIANVAKAYGEDPPFQRPAHLATDCAAANDVILHAIEFLQKQGEHFDRVILLQPTSPLRTSKDIDDALSLMDVKHADSVIGVSLVSEPPQWMQRFNEDGIIKDYFPELEKPLNRQDLNVPYIVNGAIYITSMKQFQTTKHISSGIIAGYIMSKDRAVDIDEEIDFKLAELLLKEKIGWEE